MILFLTNGVRAAETWTSGGGLINVLRTVGEAVVLMWEM